MPTNRRTFIKQATTGILAMPDIAKKATYTLPQFNKAANEDDYWRLVRKQFPLSTNRTYLNNGTMGPSPYPVIETVNKYMTETDVNGHYGGWEYSHKKIASFVGVHEDEIALTANVTQGINIACWGLPLIKGDEVIITTHEHAGNALPWLNRAKHDGIILKTFTPAFTADETLDRIKSLYNNNTKVIAVPHVLCTQGQILPVKEISSWAKSKGLFVFIDGAHGPGMLSLNIHEIGCDAYASCCHKWMLGPKGTGFLYVRKEMQETIKAIYVGAGSDQAQWNMATLPPVMGELANNAHRYYGGTLNNALFKGVDTAIDFINEVGIKRIEARIQLLANYFQQGLLDMGDKIELFTPIEQKSKGGIIGFRIRNYDFRSFYDKALAENIVIRYVHENKIDSLRVSTHIYNNTSEIDRLLALIQSVA
jgi:cysteine desulfurase/selenocysteine lyase